MTVVYHGIVGDPPSGSVFFGYGESTSRMCFCACSVCISGRCCQDNATVGYVPPTYTATGSGASWLPLTVSPTCAGLQRDHEYAVFDPSRLFCRKCGETKAV